MYVSRNQYENDPVKRIEQIEIVNKFNEVLHRRYLSTNMIQSFHKFSPDLFGTDCVLSLYQFMILPKRKETHVADGR